MLLTLRAGRENLLGDIASILFKIFPEARHQFASRIIVSGAIVPGATRVQDGIRHVRDALGNMQAKNRIGLGGHILQSSIHRGADHCPRIRQIDPLAYAKGATRPTGVDQPDLRIMAADLFAEQIGVDPGCSGRKGAPKQAEKVA